MSRENLFHPFLTQHRTVGEDLAVFNLLQANARGHTCPQSTSHESMVCHDNIDRLIGMHQCLLSYDPEEGSVNN